MAPETFTNVNVELDQQTDVWALGVILMWMMTALQLLWLEPGQWGQGQGEQVDGFDDHLHAGSLSGWALCSILAWIKMKVGNLTSSGSCWSMAAFDFFLNSDVMICNAQAGDASEWLARSWDYRETMGHHGTMFCFISGIMPAETRCHGIVPSFLTIWQ